MSSQNEERIRPITTGEIGLMQFAGRSKLNERSNHIKSLIPPEDDLNIKNGEIRVRPRAMPSYVPTNRNNKESTVSNKKNRPKGEKGNRKQKSKQITDLWASLNHFSRNNLGRSLNDESMGETVHFVNIEDDTSQSDILMEKREPIETKSGKFKMISSSQFTIPELPSGKLLQFNILSTWGDPHYLGLTGIEIFDQTGHPVKINNPDQQIWADPADINVLPEYQNDPRTVDNLLDGVNLTCDDLHAWLTPFTSGKDHMIWIEFEEPTTISMIRIWNYNKSRIHSFRGARYIEIQLDNHMIFKGEIRKAPGAHSIYHDFDSCCECILFTTDQRILCLVERYDPIYQEYLKAIAENQKEAQRQVQKKKELLVTHLQEKEQLTNSSSQDSELDHQVRFLIPSDVRPMTCANNSRGDSFKSRTPRSIPNPEISQSTWNTTTPVRPSTASIIQRQKAIAIRQLELCFTSNWGDLDFIGLTGLCGLDENMKELTLPIPVIFYGKPDDLNKSGIILIEDLDNSLSPLLVNEINNTVDKRSMVCVPKPSASQGYFCLHFEIPPGSAKLKGIKVWNYNANVDDTYFGVKHLMIYINGNLSTQALVRKAPGNSLFDFSQNLSLQFHPSLVHSHSMLTIPTMRKTDLNNNVSCQAFSSKAHFTNEFDGNSFLSEDDDEINSLDESLDILTFTNNTLDELKNNPKSICQIPQQYETPSLPSGTMIKIVLNSTHGDLYYLGLNGLQVLDESGIPLDISSEQIHATPYRDLNDLPEIKTFGGDARILSNVLDGINDTFDDRHMWLTAFSGQGAYLENDNTQNNKGAGPNSIFILFDNPVTISCVKFWNYSKTPTRGVKEIDVCLKIIYLSF